MGESSKQATIYLTLHSAIARAGLRAGELPTMYSQVYVMDQWNSHVASAA